MKLLLLLIISLFMISCTASDSFNDGTNGSTKIEDKISYYDGTNGFISSFYEKEVPVIKKNFVKKNNDEKNIKENSSIASKEKETKTVNSSITKESSATSESKNKKDSSSSLQIVKTEEKKQDNNNKTITTSSSKLNFLYPIDTISIKNDFSNAAENKNSGIDFYVSKNTAIKAAAPGIVIFSGEKNSLGKSVFLYHNSGYITIYYNLNSLSVNKGDHVTSSDTVIGTASDYFHFEIRKQNNDGISIIDPKNLLTKRRK